MWPDALAALKAGEEGEVLEPEYVRFENLRFATQSGTQDPSEERQFSSGMLSPQVEYRLMVRGAVGPRELGWIIKILQVQLDMFEDEHKV